MSAFLSQRIEAGDILLELPALFPVISVDLPYFRSGVRIYHGEDIIFYLEAVQHPDRSEDTVVGGGSAFCVAALVVRLPGAVYGNANEEMMFTEKPAPLLIDLEAVCLKRV